MYENEIIIHSIVLGSLTLIGDNEFVLVTIILDFLSMTGIQDKCCGKDKIV